MDASSEASTIRSFSEQHFPSEGVTADLNVAFVDGQAYDTVVTLNGEFCIYGGTRSQFLAKLGALIDEFRI